MRAFLALGVALLAGACGNDNPACDDCADAALAIDAAPTPDALVELQPADRALYLWQGYDHEWLRTVVGFRVPHRISKFDSYVADEIHQGEGESWQSSARFHFGQATGVDGNFMKPDGFYGAVHAPGLYVRRGDVHLMWTDDVADVEIDGTDYPRAESTRQETVEIDLTAPELGYGQLDSYDVVLQGIELQTTCDDAKQPPGEPCNSNGMWPYRFAVEIAACDRDGSTLRCPLTVEMHRAWTPNRGGLPGIEEKPLNKRLDFDLRVFYATLGGNDGEVALQRGATVSGDGLGRDDTPFTASASIVGQSGGQYPHAAVALTRFGFDLYPANGQASQNHLGRYIGALGVRVQMQDYDPATGVADVEHISRLWVPDTVAQTGVGYQSAALLIQIEGDGVSHGQRTVAGSLCSNSSDQAPPFSTWERCDEPDKGPEQTHDAQEVSLP